MNTTVAGGRSPRRIRTVAGISFVRRALAAALAAAAGTACIEGTGPGQASVTAVVGNNGPLAGGSQVIVLGRHLDQGVDSVLFGGRRLQDLFPVDGTHLTGRTPPGAAPGPVDVTVYTSIAGARTCARCFTYNPAIAIGTITPDSGTLDGGTPVVIRGAHFPALLDSVRLGLSLLGNLAWVDDTVLIGTTPSAPRKGAADLTVFSRTGGTATCSACFVYGPSVAMLITGVSPGSGDLGGGTPLTITGAHFPAAVDSVLVGTGRLLNVVRVSDSVLTGVTPSTLTPGYVDVTVMASSGASRACIACYRYAPRLDGSWKDVQAGDFATCGLTRGGTVYCWGANWVGQLGDGSTVDHWSPATVSGGLAFASITMHGDHACALTAAGAAYCWGAGQLLLPDSQITSRLVPGPVGGAIAFAQLAAGGAQSCGVTAAGTVYCWGANGLGELGDGSQTASVTPSPVAGGFLFESVFAGDFAHACALTAAGQGFCWGRNNEGELSFPPTNIDSIRAAPTAISGYFAFATMALGMYHTCGLTPTGVVYCWGFNDQGQLGDGSTTSRPYPVAVPSSPGFVSLAAGGEHTCGLTSVGAAYCWGDNFAGDLGDGTGDARLFPVAVLGGIPFVRLSAGNSHTCGVTSGGAAYCWGDNQTGALGIGSRVASFVPALVPNP